MARVKDRYVKGDYNVICDRTGFKKKRSECRFEWNNSLVHRDEWEARHPQDFVKGVRDVQSVPDPRPGATDVHTHFETTLDGDETASQTTLSVTSTSNLSAGDTVTVFLDNNETFTSTVSSFVAGDTITIATGIPSKASSGNRVVYVNNAVQESSL